MSSAQGLANHGLYLGRILLAAWQSEVEAAQTPASILSQAYLPAVRAHLVRAYGWFLLEILRPEPLPAVPPRGCAELPGLAAGKALPGEIRELARLEQSGWIGDMLAAEAALPAAGSADNLAVAESVVGPAEARRWADALQALFDRMGDSLEEY